MSATRAARCRAAGRPAHNRKHERRRCSRCGKEKLSRSFPTIQSLTTGGDEAPLRDIWCRKCVAEVDAPLTCREKREARQRNARRHQQTRRLVEAVKFYKRRRLPLPYHLQEAFGVPADITGFDPDPAQVSKELRRI